MSRKNTVNYEVISNEDATQNITSQITNVTYLDSGSYIVQFTEQNTGTFIVQARTGKYREDQSDEGWIDLDFGTALDITGETQVCFLLNELPFSEIRLKWVPSSGDGLISCVLFAKVSGA